MRKTAASVAVLALFVAGCSTTTAGTSHPPTPGSSSNPNAPKSIAPSDIAALSSAAAAASSEQPPPTEDSTPSGPTALPIGSPLDVSDSDAQSSLRITVTKVRTATVEPGEFGSTPSHGLYVIFNVKAVGTGGAIDVNSLDFYVLGANKAHYEDPEYSDSWGAAFESGTLHDGEHITGTLVYDVAKAAKHGRIYYSPNLDGDPIAYWKY